MTEGDPDEGDGDHPSEPDDRDGSPASGGRTDTDEREADDREADEREAADRDGTTGAEADGEDETGTAGVDDRVETNDESGGDEPDGEVSGGDESDEIATAQTKTDHDRDGVGDDETADGEDGAESSADADEGDSGNDVSISGEPPDPPDPSPVGGIGSSAPDDEEMPLTAHIEEMVKRLAVIVVIMALVSAVVFPLGDRLINFLWYSFLPGPPTECVQRAAAAAGNATNGTGVLNGTGVVNGTVANATNGTAADGAGSATAACPRLYHPLALVLSRLKVASLGGFIVALPVFVYQTYLFMRPGLYPNERRYYLASVPTSLILAAVGVAFAYFLVLPIIFTYFLGYSQPVAEVAFGLTETFDLIILMLGMFAVIFQIPLFVMLAIMMGVTSRRWLEDRRLYFWFAFAGIAFLFSPDPTGMAPFIVALTMVVLFEATLLLLRWTGR